MIAGATMTSGGDRLQFVCTSADLAVYVAQLAPGHHWAVYYENETSHRLDPGHGFPFLAGFIRYEPDTGCIVGAGDYIAHELGEDSTLICRTVPQAAKLLCIYHDRKFRS